MSKYVIGDFKYQKNFTAKSVLGDLVKMLKAEGIDVSKALKRNSKVYNDELMDVAAELAKALNDSCNYFLDKKHPPKILGTYHVIRNPIVLQSDEDSDHIFIAFQVANPFHVTYDIKMMEGKEAEAKLSREWYEAERSKNK